MELRRRTKGFGEPLRGFSVVATRASGVPGPSLAVEAGSVEPAPLGASTNDWCCPSSSAAAASTGVSFGSKRVRTVQEVGAGSASTGVTAPLPGICAATARSVGVLAPDWRMACTGDTEPMTPLLNRRGGAPGQAKVRQVVVAPLTGVLIGVDTELSKTSALLNTEFSSMDPARLRVLQGMFSTEFSSIDPARLRGPLASIDLVRLRGPHATLARRAAGALRRSSKDTGDACDGIAKLESPLPRRGMQNRPLIGGLDIGVPVALTQMGVS